MGEKKNRRLTIEDVARALGVSKTTVSRSLSGKGRIGKETRQRVLEYIEQHNYQPNMVAKGLAQSKTYNICVVYPLDYMVEELSFFQKCMMGVVRRGAAEDYDVILAMASNSDITQLKRIIKKHKIDGVVLLRTYKEDACIKYLQKNEIPFVAVGSTEEPGVVQVDHDNLGAARSLTRYLLEEGCERIALIGGNSSYMVKRNRMLGYCQAFESMGRTADGRMVYMNRKNENDIDACVEDALRKNVDCIIAEDEITCRKVLWHLREEEIKIPGDVMVASFYESRELWQCHEAVITLKFNVRMLGKKACECLIMQIKGENVPERTLLGFELMDGDGSALHKVNAMLPGE